MKIVRIIARLNVGGPARHVIWLTAGLRSKGYKSVLVAGTVPPGEDDMNYFALENGVIPTYIPSMSREISLGDFVSVWKLYRLLLRERPDIVHTHTAKAGTLGRLAALFYRWSTPKALLGRPRPCQLVHTYHGHIFHSYYGPLKTCLFLLIERALARLGTNRIVVVSEQQRTEINERFRVGERDQFAVIPLGLDVGGFAGWKERGQAVREEWGAAPQELLIGSVGRLTAIKNHELFFQAIKLFKEGQPRNYEQRVRFIVIGDGALRTKLEMLVEQSGLRGDVIFAGTRTDPENFYPALDIVALTSLNEGTPLTLLEAMANARPVIATAVGGVVDLLGQTISEHSGYFVCRRGIRVPSGEPNEFAAGLAQLVTDPALRRELGARGLEFVVKNYSKERLLSDVESLYGELMQIDREIERVNSTERRIESQV